MDSILPLKYSRYSNSCNSCYFAGLWALLHVPSNPLVGQLIKWIEKNDKTSDKYTLATHILRYYTNIHNTQSEKSDKQFNLNLKEFRIFLQSNYSHSGNWTTEQKDTSELINIIFNNFEIKYQVNPNNSIDLNQIFTSEPDGILFNLNYWYNGENGENFLGIKTETSAAAAILPKFELKSDYIIEYINNSLILSYPKENSGYTDTLEIGTNNYNPPFDKIYKQVIYQPKFVSFYLNRTSYQSKQIDKKMNSLPELTYTKDNARYPIEKSYGPLELYSIVIHTGGASGGHYVCYFKQDNHWYLFDDIGRSIQLVTKDPTENYNVLSNWNFLVYFNPSYFDPEIDKQIKQQDFLKLTNYSTTLEFETNTNPNLNPDSNPNTLNKQIENKFGYKLKPITLSILLGLIGWAFYSESNEESDRDQNELVYLVGILSIVISELISPDESIGQTVTKFINFLLGLNTNTNSSQIGSGFGYSLIIIKKTKELIYHITQILTSWTSANKSIPIEKIVQDYKSIILNPISTLINKMELAKQTKSIQMGINILVQTINESNYKIFLKADISEQIKILRGLGWKVLVTQSGKSKLISWDNWVQIGPDPKLIQIKQKVPTPIVKYLINTYIANINKSNLTK